MVFLAFKCKNIAFGADYRQRVYMHTVQAPILTPKRWFRSTLPTCKYEKKNEKNEQKQERGKKK